jgi:hypothetical protein
MKEISECLMAMGRVWIGMKQHSGTGRGVNTYRL